MEHGLIKMNSRLSKIVCLFLIICLSLITLPPDGLSKEAWILASIYLATIIGLVSNPYPEPVIIIAALAASCIAITHFSGSTIKPLDVVNGYFSGTTWLVFSAFTLSAAFVSTGLCCCHGSAICNTRTGYGRRSDNLFISHFIF